ncbi:hypothetical protein [Paraburkholderia bryophila]|uniref:Uncharacterized protein n=1 Tax=Paraburkholderia bryophila TaxID=420952 RepID=A0A7Y9WFS1_9BURK|nr:hypothetical protein [Paraburkholderia bryophila]NYH19989.1 hypothetical protein [Paraburkholderia bryophila]NYH20973.1 hypothetical protein [Paraburkholderia bryophila]
MSVLDYTDRFVTNLLVGALVTCWTMSAVNYFDWFDNGVAGIEPEVVQVCLVAVLVTTILFVLPWLWHALARSRCTPLGVTQGRAGACPGRVTGMAFGLFAAVSILAQMR